MTNKKNFKQLMKTPTKFESLLRGYKQPIKLPRPPNGSIIVNPTVSETNNFLDKIEKQG